MAMRIGTVDGKPCKRVRKNSTGSTIVQPVEKVKDINGVERLVNYGEQFEVDSKKFIKGKV